MRITNQPLGPNEKISSMNDLTDRCEADVVKTSELTKETSSDFTDCTKTQVKDIKKQSVTNGITVQERISKACHSMMRNSFRKDKSYIEVLQQPASVQSE